jgi:predicted RNA binding protein with dsRBD fold (UPF0201 family)
MIRLNNLNEAILEKKIQDTIRDNINKLENREN